ncbi:ABC transporter ATP-binding protein [Mesorhizobium sp. AaZ16]|uniref:ABC transporter ATP-binding protein n=1 Tax=Mesorhizobium sp. AaZ16 TaxID=3402289 RepID=UPI00374EB97E
MKPLLSVVDITASYGRVQVLRGVSIQLNASENIGLFGPNGHGKTTLLRAISGLVRCTSGCISFYGVDLTNRSPRSIVEQGVIHAPQGNLLFPNLTIAETIQLGAHRWAARPNIDRNRELVVEIFPKLAQRWRQRVSTLSGGERQMVSIGMALMNQPKLLMLDEPTLGLSPKVKDELCQAIGSISKQNIPLIVVEQDVEFLLELTERLYLISHGENETEVARGQGADHHRLMEMYFGLEAR